MVRESEASAVPVRESVSVYVYVRVPEYDTVLECDSSAVSDRVRRREGESVKRDSETLADGLGEVDALPLTVADASALRLRVRCRDTVSVKRDSDGLADRRTVADQLAEAEADDDALTVELNVRESEAVPADFVASAV